MPSELVVFETDRVFIAASNTPGAAMEPRHMNGAERALLERDPSATGPLVDDGDISIPVHDDTGRVVAALSLLGANERDVAAVMNQTGLGALVRLLKAELDTFDAAEPDFFRTLVNGQRDAVIILAPDLSVKWVSQGVVSLLSRSPSDVIGRSAVDFLHPDDLEITLDAIAKFVEGLAMYRVNVRVLDGNGEYNPIEVTGTDLSTDPTIGGLVLNLRDANYAKEFEEAIEGTRRLSAAIVGSFRDALVATDRFGSITLVNDVAREIFDLPADRTTAQLSLDDFALVTTEGRRYEPLMTPNVETRCLLSGPGTVRYLNCMTQPVAAEDGDETGYVLVFTDVTQEHRAAEELRVQALHDHLTGLPNRRQLDTKITELENATEHPGVAACFIDLDGFKLVNDNHGHRVGDRLLRIAADRLAAELRDQDLLVRHGGDEFVALLTDLDDIGEAERTAERCRAALMVPYEIGRERFDLTASIGVAFSPSGERHGESLLRHADIALHTAKDHGRNRVVAFDRSLADAVTNEQNQRRLLRDALDADRVVMHFQPLIDASTERTKGYEALARVRTADGAILTPSHFLDAVANTGLMWELDRRAFQLSCRAAFILGKIDPDRRPYIACNFSPVSLSRADFAEFVLSTLTEIGVSPDQVQVELTETAAFTVGSQSESTLRTLCDAGIHLALDDFGTGYSSLAHLRDLPITTVKVDRSFITRLADNNSERSITEAVVALARDLDLGVVAEGVETLEQLSHARAIGIETIQGWHYSPALPLAQCVEDWTAAIVPAT